MANDFSDHQDCVALWRFEDAPGFAIDSQGSNNLTNDGADQENTIIKEGAQSAKFIRANTDKMTITDANQDAGFPWRFDDGGSIVKDFSICGWVRINTLPGSNGEAMYVIDKYNTVGDLRVFGIWINDTFNKVTLAMGHTNGTAYEEVQFGTACAINKWYHVGITYKASDKSYRIRVWDDNASAFLGADSTGNFTNATDARDVGLTIGARGDSDREFDGYLDELVVFNSVLTIDEIDDIRKATYPEVLTSGVSDSDSVSLNGWQYYKIDSSADDTLITVDLTGLTADGDLYLRKNAFPTTSTYDDRSVAGGTTSEQCELANTEAATWYIGIFGYAATDFIVEAMFEVEVSAGVDALVLTEYNATVNKEISFTAGIDALAITEYLANVNKEISFIAGVDALVITEYAAAVNKEVSFTAGIDALVLTEYTATITIVAGGRIRRGLLLGVYS